jgi:hypothetical protein
MREQMKTVPNLRPQSRWLVTRVSGEINAVEYVETAAASKTDPAAQKAYTIA